jgi:hypothetical protein
LGLPVPPQRTSLDLLPKPLAKTLEKLIGLRPVGTAPRVFHPRSLGMKFIVEASFPHEPFNSYVRDGSAGERIGETLQALHPEVVYFTDLGVGRGILMIVDVADASQMPHVTEPLMLTFNASVHYRIAIAPEELAAAGLDKYATG